MKNDQATILHVRPDYGGLVDYGEAVKKLYELRGHRVETIPCAVTMPVTELLAQIRARPADLTHFEIGLGQATIFWSSWLLSRYSRRKQMATVHDPGLVVTTRVALLDHDPKQPALVRAPVRALRGVTNLTIRRGIIPGWLRDRSVTKLYLRPDLAEKLGGHYFPQPTYHRAMPALPSRHDGPLRVGFAGYWGPEKGVETLLDAVARCRSRNAFVLVLGGGAVFDETPFVAAMKRRAEDLGVPVEMPGFVPSERLDAFLQGLSALVLPYWPELPSGTSAMSMRAAELGVPMIASSTPALTEQLGPEGALYVAPKDPTALALGLDQFVADPEAHRRRAAKNQARIFEDHGWDVVSGVLDETVRRVLA